MRAGHASVARVATRKRGWVAGDLSQTRGAQFSPVQAGCSRVDFAAQHVPPPHPQSGLNTRPMSRHWRWVGQAANWDFVTSSSGQVQIRRGAAVPGLSRAIHVQYFKGSRPRLAARAAAAAATVVALAHSGVAGGNNLCSELGCGSFSVGASCNCDEWCHQYVNH